jgi:hypothetical protein
MSGKGFTTESLAPKPSVSVNGSELDHKRIQCPGCERRFVKQYAGQKFHSKRCGEYFHRRKYRREHGAREYRAAAISATCKSGKHNNCFNRNCICPCGHPSV